MLGNKILESQGKITGRRVLPSEGGPEVEITIAERGKLAGLDGNSIATYNAKMKPDGSLYGQGQGVVMSDNGEGASFVGSGSGRFTQAGGVSFRGVLLSLFYDYVSS